MDITHSLQTIVLNTIDRCNGTYVQCTAGYRTHTSCYTPVHILQCTCVGASMGGQAQVHDQLYECVPTSKLHVFICWKFIITCKQEIKLLIYSLFCFSICVCYSSNCHCIVVYCPYHPTYQKQFYPVLVCDMIAVCHCGTALLGSPGHHCMCEWVVSCRAGSDESYDGKQEKEVTAGEEGEEEEEELRNILLEFWNVQMRDF